MGKTDVVDVKIKRMGNDIYRFVVTVLHRDEGWGHYADSYWMRLL